MMTDTNLNNIHRDVLYCSIPTEEHNKLKLIEEIIDRAKKSFALKCYYDAELLYSRAIIISNNFKYNCNRSLIYSKQGKFKLALEDAKLVINKLPNWPKGYLRAAQALEGQQKYDKAICFCQKALEKINYSNNKTDKTKDKPDNIKKLLNTLILKLQNLKKKKTPNEHLLRDKFTIDNSNNSNINNTFYDSDCNSDSSDIDLSFRGYHIREDGTKTTYFNREATEEAKQLIGDIKPKKI